MSLGLKESVFEPQFHHLLIFFSWGRGGSYWGFLSSGGGTWNTLEWPWCSCVALRWPRWGLGEWGLCSQISFLQTWNWPKLLCWKRKRTCSAVTSGHDISDRLWSQWGGRFALGFRETPGGHCLALVMGQDVRNRRQDSILSFLAPRHPCTCQWFRICEL